MTTAPATDPTTVPAKAPPLIDFRSTGIAVTKLLAAPVLADVLVEEVINVSWPKGVGVVGESVTVRTVLS